MADPNLDEFKDRVDRIQRDRKRGFGMEAAGTLGRSAATRRQRRRLAFLPPVVLLLVIGIVFKAVLLNRIGPEAYDIRLGELKSGAALDQIGAFLMTVDPVTLFVSEQLKAIGL